MTLVGGIRHGRTLGSPVAIEIANTEWPKWETEMSPDPGLPSKVLTQPRPGHADLSGMLKYGFDDARDVLERASARETAARVAAGHVGQAAAGADRRRRAQPHRAARSRAGRVRRPAPVGRPRPGRRVPGALLRSRRRGPDGRRGEGGGQGRRLARRGGRGPRLRRPGGPRQPRALGPSSRRPAGPGPHEHPGRQGRRVRRRLRAGRPAGLGGPRRHPGGDGRRRPTADGDAEAARRRLRPRHPPCRRDRRRHLHRSAHRGPGRR